MFFEPEYPFGTVRVAHDLVVGWAGQSGVLAPWDVTAVAAPRLLRHLSSISDLGIKYLTNRFHVAVRLFSNRSQMTSKCGKNK